MFDVLDLFVPGMEFWNATTEEFVYTKDITLHLKHSLVSLTRWEQHYKRRFLDDGPKNSEEVLFPLIVPVTTILPLHETLPLTVP